MEAWLEEVICALKDLGGEATLSDIYARIVERGKINLSKYSSELGWQSIIRKTIYKYAEECDLFTGRDVLFYSVEGKRKGVWGLKKSET